MSDQQPADDNLEVREVRYELAPAHELHERTQLHVVLPADWGEEVTTDRYGLALTADPRTRGWRAEGEYGPEGYIGVFGSFHPDAGDDKFADPDRPEARLLEVGALQVVWSSTPKLQARAVLSGTSSRHPTRVFVCGWGVASATFLRVLHGLTPVT